MDLAAPPLLKLTLTRETPHSPTDTWELALAAMQKLP